MAKEVRVGSIRRNRLALAVAAALVPLSHGAQAQVNANTLPTGGNVTAGAATISHPGAFRMQIDQASDKAILQWQSFSIGSAAWVNFTQPSASAIALNRVLGNNPSQIFGRLTANGQVFLSNPNGVLFAPGASVDVGGLFATTLSIADSDFLAGRYNFSNGGKAGSVVNQGLITASGYAALAGPQVRNDGIIVANSGTVALAAGNRVALDMIGDGLISVSVDQSAMNAVAINAGTIQADGGRVILTARSANALLDTVVNNSGIIRANSLVERNGEIVLDGGSAGVVANSGALQGAAASVTMTGDKVNIDPGSSIDAAAAALTLAAGSDIKVNAPIAGSMTFTASAGHDMTVASAINVGNTSVDVAGTLRLDAAGQDARLSANGGQTIQAGQLTLHAENGHRAVVANNGGDQTVSVASGGIALEVVNGLGVAQIANNLGAATNGAQTVQTSGALNVVGGSGGGSSNSGVFQNQTGKQTVTAGSIFLQGANAAVSSGGAFITNTTGGGDQEINVASGTISVAAGSVGLGNRAGISSSGNQTINGNADIVVSGGSSGNGVFNLNTSNSASISTIAGKTQTINAKSITVNAGSGGSDTFATIVGGTQNITATGDVVLNGGGGSGTANGARIGGATTTNLTLGARNLTLNAGATTGAGLGSSIIGTPQAATISVKTTGDVILNASDGNGVRIGGSQQNGTAGGAISVEAGGKIELNGASQPAAIRTLDTVALTAGGAITENGNSLIVAHSLSTASGDSTLLGGPNQIVGFNATSGGDALLTNTGSLNVTGLTAGGSATLDNTGNVTLSGPWSSGGATSITAHSDLVLQNLLTGSSVVLNATSGSLREEGAGAIAAGSLATTSLADTLLGGANQVSTFTGTGGGTMSLANSGALSITGISAGSLALANAGDVVVTGAVTANGDTSVDVSGAFNVDRTTFQTIGGTQAISAGSLAVTGGNGRVASLTQTGPGSQSITLTGGSIDIQVAGGGGAANVTADSVQDIALVNGDHININGAFGGVFVAPGIAGTQTISATGTGRNAITVGSAGAFGRSFVGGGSTQTITAGEGAQSGSITIVGSAAQSALAGFVSNPSAGGTQTISTSGQISVTGGSAAAQLPNFSAGIFHNGSGQQTINAAGITVNGGTAGTGNRAFVSSQGGVAGNAGDQVINVSGTIAVTAGSVGSGNRAGITTNGNQTINGNPDIVVTGGANGGGVFSDNTSNSASISVNVLGKQQTINARNITVNAGAGGSDTFATIIGPTQIVNATGDVTLNGGGGFGGANGARIGGNTATNLTLSARNVTLKAGTTTGAGLGSSVAGAPQPNTINIAATGDVVLNASDGNGVRIGSSVQNGTAGGDISVSAGGKIALNGAAQPAAIRTLGNVTLSAGSQISESGNGLIVGNALATTSGGATLLDGPNQVSSFSGTSGGAMTFTNSGPLAITNISSGGALTLSNAGAVTLDASGTQDARITSFGGQVITADGLALHAHDGRVANISNVGGDQALVVGAGGIDLAVQDGLGVAQISNSAGSGTQTVQAAGTINVVGGSTTLGSFNSGIFQNQSGKQTVTAGSIFLQGANAAVSTGGAFITNSSGGGDQEIDVASGTISVAAGGIGHANRAGISSNGNQTINGNADIVVTGGASGDGVFNLGTSNSASISNAAGRTQTINARSITVNAGSGGSDTFATIVGGTQNISATGDVVLNGGGGFGTANGARIGGAAATNVTLNARNVILNGGTTTGVGLGSSATAALPNTIAVNATGDVVLNSGASGTAGARIGSSAQTATTGGSINISADGSIALNGGALAAAIRTLGDATLHAGGAITENANGLVLANTLTTTSGGSTLLGGPNQIAGFNAASGGDVLLANTGALNVTGLSAIGSATLDNTGNVTLSGPWSSGGATSITVHSDLVLQNQLTASSVALNATTGSLREEGAGAIEADSLTSMSAGDTLLNGANQVSAFTGTSGGVMSLANSGSLAIGGINASGALTLADAGAVSLNAGAGQDARLTSFGGQTITADQLSLRAQDGRVASITNIGGDQNLVIGAGGIDLDVVNSQGVAQIINLAGNGAQTVQTSGALSVVGGSTTIGSINSGLFQSQTGKQTVTAASISLQGALTGNNGGAFINNSAGGGDQEIHVADSLRITGGEVGFGNRAAIVTNGNQLIDGSAEIVLTGGASGLGATSTNSSNAAFIAGGNPTRSQTIQAASIALTSGAGGNDTFASITAANQTITATGDVIVSGSSNTTVNGSGSRIGGIRVPGTPTNLTLTARDVVLNGGSGAGSGAGLGANAGASQPQTITVNASRDVILNSGSGGAARIGTSLDVAPTGGDININAGRDIAINGAAQPAAIRTTDNLALNAGGSISESGNAFVAADALSSLSGTSAALGGANQVARFNSTSGGDLSLNNSQALQISGATSAGTMSITNAGGLTVTGMVSSNGGQTINAQSLAVNADGGVAQLANFGGDQTITVAGGSTSAIDVQTLSGGGFVSVINNGGRQSITLLNGDHIAINGAFGAAIVSSSGEQVLSATGNGRNAILLGSAGALGPTNVVASTSQSVTAGLAGESGSIDIIGSDGQNALSGFVTTPLVGGMQTISTAGEISISGGSAAAQGFNFPAGIFHNGSGQQTINAAGISLMGGNAGNTNAALINALGGGVPANAGNQVLNVGAAGIHITAGSTGSGNRAGIFGSANQTINVDGDIVITGGGGGSGFASDNSSNNAFISDNGLAGLQTINARNITINAGAGGSDTFAVIVGPHQVITATNDVVLNGGGGFGTSNGARIGGRGGQSTDLWLGAQNVVLNGGATTGAGLGSSGSGTPLPNSIAVHASGDVELNAGPGAGVRIGSGSNGLAGGDITVEASGNIALNGSATQSAAIRTTDDVTLSAGGAISESGNGLIVGNALATTSGGATLLGGPNQVSSFSGTSGGAMTFTNSGPLAITNISSGGTLTLSNAGAITLNASGSQNALIRSVGGQSISADGLVLHAQDGRVANINNTAGDQNIAIGAGGIDLDVANGQGVAQISNNRGAVTSGTQTIQTAGALNVVGGSGSGSVNSGVFQMQTGKQTVTAASISLQGATSGNNGGAFITNTSTGGLPAGDQEINVAGGTISVSGGASGLANRAGISTNGNQTINGNPDIVVTGGASGNGLNSNNTNNSAFISANAFGKTQTINAGNITLTAGSGGTDTFATITSNKQDITATGDVRITGGAGGGDSNGARIGAPGSTTVGSNITLKAHDVVLTGGTSSSGAAIGLSGNSGDLPSTIKITASGDVVLNSGSGSGSRIGAPNGSAGGGDIQVNAVNIALNGGAHQTAIRTTGKVTLNASGSISEGANGAVLANALTTTSGDATLLGGPNSVSSFAALAGGDVLLNNTSALLSLGSMSLPAALTVTQAGDLTVGSATALAPTSVYSAGPMAIAATGSISVRGSDTSAGAGSIVMSGDTLDIQASSLSLLGGAATDASAIVSGSIINATLASSLTINGGSGANSFAQVQTPTSGGLITLYFPNLSSGGYTVDGLPVTSQGPDGFFAGGQPATLGGSLMLKYGF